MQSLSQFIFRLIARRFPALWELVGGGPGGLKQTGVGAQNPAGEVALNPQPLPPKATAR